MFAKMDVMEIVFNNLNTSLSTRSLGAILRKEISEKIEINEKVVFNFEGVEVVSNSFADECFAKLLFDFDLDEIMNLTSFINTNTFVRKTISFALKQRIGQKAMQLDVAS